MRSTLADWNSLTRAKTTASFQSSLSSSCQLSLPFLFFFLLRFLKHFAPSPHLKCHSLQNVDTIQKKKKKGDVGSVTWYFHGVHSLRASQHVSRHLCQPLGGSTIAVAARHTNTPVKKKTAIIKWAHPSLQSGELWVSGPLFLHVVAILSHQAFVGVFHEKLIQQVLLYSTQMKTWVPSMNYKQTQKLYLHV